MTIIGGNRMLNTQTYIMTENYHDSILGTNHHNEGNTQVAIQPLPRESLDVAANQRVILHKEKIDQNSHRRSEQALLPLKVESLAATKPQETKKIPETQKLKNNPSSSTIYATYTRKVELDEVPSAKQLLEISRKLEIALKHNE